MGVFVFFVLLLFYRPSYYSRPESVAASSEDGEVSPYITHVLSTQLYNGAQRGEDFDLVVEQEPLNEAIGQGQWPKESDGIRFLRPSVYFVPDKIVLVGTVVVGGAELVVTIVGRVVMNEEGLLSLTAEKVQVGAVNVTFLAKVIGERIYRKESGGGSSNPESMEAKIVGSLLGNEPFEPRFEIEDRTVRIRKISIEQQKLTVGFEPIVD